MKDAGEFVGNWNSGTIRISVMTVLAAWYSLALLPASPNKRQPNQQCLSSVIFRTRTEHD